MLLNVRMAMSVCLVILLLCIFTLTFHNTNASAGEYDDFYADHMLESSGTPSGFITSFYGKSSDVSSDKENYCFNATEKSDFNWGARIAVSVFFMDEAAAGTNVYDITIKYLTPSGFYELCTERVEFQGLNVGGEYIFCTGCYIETELDNNSRLTVLWGAEIEQVDEEDGISGELGTVSLN